LPTLAIFKYKAWRGFFVHVFLFSAAAALTHFNSIDKNKQWYGNYVKDTSYAVVRLTEPTVEKTNTYKATAVVEQIQNGDTSHATLGGVVLYFSKKSHQQLQLAYGQKLLLHTPIRAIKNAGNPGGFDYKRYMFFNKTTHQVFLQQQHYQLLPSDTGKGFYAGLFNTRDFILATLKEQLGASKRVLGIAEALLIGYKEDLDKDLVQAYSNTGVVHIIAISGMHLGLIYVCLVWLCARIPLIKRNKYAQVIIILSSLWLFSLLTGASASVLRSAVMFTCIVLGKHFFTQSSIYNSLAASAFLLLCYNPFFLWDVGFQLSYLAVIGIIWLQKPLERKLYFKNTVLQNIWKLTATTLSAQVFTLPACIYYFHQIPTSFLFTNLIAVPLSTIGLFGIIALLLVCKITFLKIALSKFVFVIVWAMNYLIDVFNKLPFSVIDNIHATAVTTLLLYGTSLLVCMALYKKEKRIAIYAGIVAFGFVAVYCTDILRFSKNKKIIVYNVNKHTGIDFIANKAYSFWGDSIIVKDEVI
jgi:competence protein ComEC